jgi:hypothetical protein
MSGPIIVDAFRRVAKRSRSVKFACPKCQAVHTTHVRDTADGRVKVTRCRCRVEIILRLVD